MASKKKGRKNPRVDRNTMIPLSRPVQDFMYAEQPKLAHWSSDPDYSFDTFYRAKWGLPVATAQGSASWGYRIGAAPPPKAAGGSAGKAKCNPYSKDSAKDLIDQIWRLEQNEPFGMHHRAAWEDAIRSIEHELRIRGYSLAGGQWRKVSDQRARRAARNPKIPWKLDEKFDGPFGSTAYRYLATVPGKGRFGLLFLLGGHNTLKRRKESTSRLVRVDPSGTTYHVARFKVPANADIRAAKKIVLPLAQQEIFTDLELLGRANPTRRNPPLKWKKWVDGSRTTWTSKTPGPRGYPLLLMPGYKDVNGLGHGDWLLTYGGGGETVRRYTSAAEGKRRAVQDVADYKATEHDPAAFKALVRRWGASPAYMAMLNPAKATKKAPDPGPGPWHPGPNVVFTKMPTNAGPYLPNMFPFGQGGRKATYKNPAGDARVNPALVRWNPDAFERSIRLSPKGGQYSLHEYIKFVERRLAQFEQSGDERMLTWWSDAMVIAQDELALRTAAGVYAPKAKKKPAKRRKVVPPRRAARKKKAASNPLPPPSFNVEFKTEQYRKLNNVQLETELVYALHDQEKARVFGGWDEQQWHAANVHILLAEIRRRKEKQGGRRRK